jgi:hypothetical protein
VTERNNPQEPSAPAQPDLSLPDPQTTPYEGKVEAEKFGYASELLAYRVMDNLANIVAQKIGVKLGQGDPRVLLVSDLEYALGGLPLVEIREQISLLRDAFAEREEEQKALLEPQAEPTEPDRREQPGWSAASAVLTAATLLGQAPKMVGAITEIASYFRSNYRITERDFDLADHALFSSVAGALIGRGIKTFISGFYPVEGSEILSDLMDLSKWAVRLKVQREVLASQLPESNKEDEPNQLPAEQLRKIITIVRETDAALLSYEGIRTNWIAPSESQQGTKLEKALMRERIEKLEITHLLWVGNLSSGGEAAVRDRLIREDTIGFMGGTVVAFVLVSVEGEVIAADTFSQFGVMGFRLSEYVGGDGTVRYVPPYPHGSYETTS